MDLNDLMEYLESKPHVEACFPFDEHTLVYKAGGKMYALIALERVPAMLNLKCDPERSIELRERYQEITPGYHMNKTHWNSIDYTTLDWSLLKELIDHSYELILNSLTKKQKQALGL